MSSANSGDLSSRETDRGTELSVRQLAHTGKGLRALKVLLGVATAVYLVIWPWFLSAPTGAGGVPPSAAGVVLFLGLFGLASVASWVLGRWGSSAARFTITSVSLRIDAWMGSPRRLQTRTLPLEGLTFRYDTVTERKETLYRLTLKSSGSVTVSGLQCTTAELEALIAAVWDRRARARSLMGDGEAEVPQALRRVVQERPESI